MKVRHPGERVFELLRSREISVTAGAELFDCSRVTLSNFLHGHASVSIKMALAVKKAFGIPARELLYQQVDFDLKQATKR